MKTPILFSVLTLFGLTTSAWAKTDLPAAENFARYEPMLKRSPFAVATAGAPVGATPDFARDLYVANAAHSPDGDFVTVASTTNKDLKEYLTTRETVDGYSISNILWSDRVGETKVTITKDGQFATLTFNEALLSQAIQNPVAPIAQPPPPGVGVPGRPGFNGRPNGNVPPPVRPATVPQIPTPPPHVRPTIPRKVSPAKPNVPPQADDDESDLDNP